MNEFKPKVKRNLTTFNLQEGETVHVKFTGKLKEDSSGKITVYTCDAINLETGEPITLLTATVLRKVLTENSGGYEGKCFSITKLPQDDDHNYFTFRVAEIEDPEEGKKAK